MKTLYRSRTNRVIAGIMGGLAENYGIDPNLLRFGVVILGLLTGTLPLLVIAYLVAWAVIPEQTTITTP